MFPHFIGYVSEALETKWLQGPRDMIFIPTSPDYIHLEKLYCQPLLITPYW